MTIKDLKAMSKIVNTDIICLIRQNGDQTVFETIDIPKSKELIERLEEMKNDSTSNVIDMQTLMNSHFTTNNRATLDYISPYSYESSFIEPAKYPESISSEEYHQLLNEETQKWTERYSSIQNELKNDDPNQQIKNLQDYLNHKIALFKDSLKHNYYRKALRYIHAVDYEKFLSELKEQPTVKMYSTDTVGWSTFYYQITDDVRITLKTNFGFGSSSYFLLSLQFKNIDILPYSYTIKYYWAKMEDLIRGTRMFSPNHGSWICALSFVEASANLASNDEKAFINKWITEEIRTMIHGLEVILNSPQEYMESLIAKRGEENASDYITVRNMTDSEYAKYQVYPHEMTLAIRTEKVTGSLSFLDNLMKLSTEIPDVYSYINRIKEMALAILPEIRKSINDLTTQIEKLNIIKESIDKKIERVLKLMEPHTTIIKKLYEEERKSNIYILWSIIEENYAKVHADYQILYDDLHQLYKDKSNNDDEIKNRCSFLDELKECEQRTIYAGIINEDVA